MPRRALPIEPADRVALTERRVARSLLLGAGAVAFALVATLVFLQVRTEILLRESVGMDAATLERQIANGRVLTALALFGSLLTLLLVLYLIMTRLLRAMLDAERRLDELASHDALTGLLNRRVAMIRLHEETSRAEREHIPLAVMMVDLDRFKDVNDTYGHPAGDAVLIAAGYALTTEAREYDVVARMGGEEFLVLLPGTTLEAARPVAERMRRRIEETTRIAVPQLARGVTASVGVAVQAEHSDEDCDDVLVRADRALYSAKEHGRDRVVVA